MRRSAGRAKRAKRLFHQGLDDLWGTGASAKKEPARCVTGAEDDAEGGGRLWGRWGGGAGNSDEGQFRI